MKYLLLFLMCVACAPKANTDAVDAQSTAKVWSSQIPWWSVDLQPVNGEQIIHWALAYGQTCISAAALKDGVMTIALSMQTSALQGTDTNCSMFDGSWTYSGALTLCQASKPCVVMQ